MKCLGVFCKIERKIRTYQSYKKISFDNFKSRLSHNLANEYDNSYLKFEKYFVTLLDKCGRQKKKFDVKKKLPQKSFGKQVRPVSQINILRVIRI